MLPLKHPLTLLLLFTLTLAIACCSHSPIPSANATNSAYGYLARVADQYRTNAKLETALNKTKPNTASFLVSYETTASKDKFDITMRDVAFTYDNAIAAQAFIVTNDKQRAQQIVDAIVYAQNSDRYFKDGRIRNAYRGSQGLGKEKNVQLPGWYDEKAKRWQEDEFQVSTHTGNVAWSMLALLSYYQTYGGEQYLNAAVKMGEWVEKNCRDNRGAGGYTGGYGGWEPKPKLLQYKSTEHNLDLYPAFQRLYLITRDQVWQERAAHAKKFVLAMWDQKEGKYWTGTGTDGVQINYDFIPVDVQAWVPLAFQESTPENLQALKYAEKHHRVGNGFDFNSDRDGIWYEGTAQMAVAYQFTGQPEKAKATVTALQAAQATNGGIPATNKEKLTTGVWLPDGQPWLYFPRLHIGATAWTIFAYKEINPFWLGSK